MAMWLGRSQKFGDSTSTTTSTGTVAGTCSWSTRSTGMVVLVLIVREGMDKGCTVRGTSTLQYSCTTYSTYSSLDLLSSARTLPARTVRYCCTILASTVHHRSTGIYYASQGPKHHYCSVRTCTTLCRMSSFNHGAINTIQTKTVQHVELLDHPRFPLCKKLGVVGGCCDSINFVQALVLLRTSWSLTTPALLK